MELRKKEYIDKLKGELDIIDKRYQHLINSNAMIGEDYRSQGLECWYENQRLSGIIDDLSTEISDQKE